MDEIHKHAQWSRDLKSVRDSFPSLRMIVSGSSMLHICRGSHDLARRALVYHIDGLSFREFLGLRLGIELPSIQLSDILSNHEVLASDVVSQLGNDGIAVLGQFRDYLQCGYYPYFLELEDPVLFRQAVAQSAHAALEADLPAVHPEITGTTIARIKKLLAALAGTTPMVPNLSRLARLVGVRDLRTMKAYLGYLEEAGLIVALTRGGGGLRNMEKPEKIYLGDPNLVCALAGSGTGDIGTLRETFFCRALLGRHTIRPAARADFVVDGRLTFEIGGRKKSADQLRDTENAYLALDELVTGSAKRIPLWLFGLLY